MQRDAIVCYAIIYIIIIKYDSHVSIHYCRTITPDHHNNDNDANSSTYIMGQRTGFNRQLNDTTRRFTYFVPRDWAWQQTETEFPSLYKKLFMPEYEYHVSFP